MTRLFIGPLLALGALASSAHAHHSVAAFYDRSVVVEVDGVVSAVFWRNPHVGLTLLVENERGDQEKWQLEGGTFNDLTRTGFETESLKIGDRIHAVGGASRRGQKAMYLSSFVLPNGQEV